MHGMVFAYLKRFADERCGPQIWPALLRDAKLGSRVYLGVGEYPDAELVSLVEALARTRRTSPADMLTAFGRFMVPLLLETYGAHVRPQWSALDVIEHSEHAIHAVVRARDAQADPPRLKTERPHRREVVVRYASPRRLCALARGIVQGIADARGESVELEEPECMHRGAAACVLRIRAIDARAS